jgi:hypothetical protein
MKLLLIAGLLSSAAAQDLANPPAALKHLTVAPVNSIRPVVLSALSIQRGEEYPSTVELKGSVEIRTPVCISTGKPASKRIVSVCDGETVLRADEAVFHEDSGAVEARGSVTVTPVPYRRRKLGAIVPAPEPSPHTP